MNQTIKFAEGLPNLHQEKLEELKKLLPNLFDKNGNLIKDELENFAQNYTQEKQEPFAFSWAGKQKAKGMAFKQSETKLALKFDEKRSKNFDKTENLIIEGDNLHVLKLLLSSYKGKVKCIYIDPPYNTQNDFIYPDNFAESEKEYLLNSGQIDDDGDLQTDYLETAGRKHSVWLSFIYPRLVLARELLREDGVIFISIDDNEVHHLRHLMNEVFGEENLVASLIWRGGRRNMAKHVSNSHEYILFYAKDISTITEKNISFKARKEGVDDVYAQYEKLKKIYESNFLSIEKELKNWYKNLSENHPAKDISHYCCVDERGVYFANDISKGGGGGPKWDLINPITGNVVKTPSRGWAFSKYEDLLEAVKQNKVHFNGDGVPCAKSYLKEKEFDAIDSVFYKDRRAASKQFRDLMGDEIFDFPKDVSIIKKLLQISTKPNDIILDFFAGSGTTAQAVMELNQEEIDKKSKDGFLTNEEKEAGGRKFILVQLPEKINQKKSLQAYKFVADLMQKRGDENKPPVISEITIERVRRAGEKYKLVDAGFKVMTVSESAINRKLMNQIVASKEEIFAEIALFYGYGLNYKYRQLHNLGKGVSYLCGNNREALIILGEEQLENETLKEIILASDGLSQCQIFAQDTVLNVEIIHNLYQHFEQKKVVIL